MSSQEPPSVISSAPAATQVAPVAPPGMESGTVAIALTPAQKPAGIDVFVVPGATLLGVALTLAFSYYQMKRTLKAADDRAHVERQHAAHQADSDRQQAREEAARERRHSIDEARRERLATARRAIYVAAVEEVTKAQIFIADLPARDLSQVNYSAAMTGFASAMSKVALIGEMGTVVKTRELNTLMHRQFMKSMVALIPLGGLNGELETICAEKEAAKAEVARILAAMTNHNEARRNDPEGFAALQRSFDRQQERFERNVEQEAAVREAIVQVRQQHVVTMQDFTSAAVRCLDDIAVAIRQELELETDEPLLKSLTEQMLQDAKDSFAEFQADIAAFRVADAESLNLERQR